jgi:hypothetical protein
MMTPDQRATICEIRSEIAALLRRDVADQDRRMILASIHERLDWLCRPAPLASVSRRHANPKDVERTAEDGGRISWVTGGCLLGVLLFAWFLLV